MLSNAITPQNIQLLRDVTGSRHTQAQLRSALIRASGDLNRAATTLLSDPSSQPIKLPQPVSQTPQLLRTTLLQPDQASLLLKQQLPQQRKRHAWRHFYLENYRYASQQVGVEKQAIDAFIANMWKKLGSTGRQIYINKIQPTVMEEENKPAVAAAVKSEPSAASPVPSAVSRNARKHSQQPNTRTSELKFPHLAPPNSEPVFSTAVHITPNKHPSAPLQPPLPTPQQQSTEDEIQLTNPRSTSDDVAVWPRKIASRLCRGVALARGKNLFKIGEELYLSSPSPREAKRGKAVIQKLVRISKAGRDIGRLAPDIGITLGPAMQTGFVHASCKVVEAPKMVRMFSELILDISLYMSKDAFKVEKKGDGDGEDGSNANGIAILKMLSALNMCDPGGRQAGNTVDKQIVNLEYGEQPAHTEKFLNTVTAIEDGAGTSFEPPKALACTLREYQRAGVRWMIEREEKGSHANSMALASESVNPFWKQKLFMDGSLFFINTTTGELSLDGPSSNGAGPYGGILADEMGLGKTVQCIACILHDFGCLQALSNVPKNARSDKRKSRQRRGRRIEESAEDGDDDMDSVPEQHPEQCARSEMNSERTLTCNIQNSETAGTEQTSMVNIQEGLDTDAKEDPDFDNSGSKENRGTTSYARQRPARKRKRRSQMKVDSTTTESTKRDSDSDWFESPKPRKRIQTTNKPGKHRQSNRASAASILMASAMQPKASEGGTLIVCPTSLVAQWMGELSYHVKPNTLRTVAHYGSSRGDVESISCRCVDVVVTSYGVLAAEFLGDDNSDSDRGSRGGPLFQLHWRRVILDEAHTIKSRVTRWAKAAFHLEADRRWCVTGTVIHNHVNDAFSLLRFLRLEPWSVWAIWNREVVSGLESLDTDSKAKSMSLVREILASITLRRKKSTKDSKGNTIIQLSKKTVETIILTASPEEKDFYNALEKRTKLRFGTYLAQGNVMKNYASILELLLRLRQACDHPYLVIGALKQEAESKAGKDRLLARFLDGGSSQQFVQQVLNEAESGNLGKNRECPICLDMIDDAVALKECGHHACRGCMSEWVRRSRKCPTCRIQAHLASIITLPRNKMELDIKSRWRPSAKVIELMKDLRVRQEARQSNGRAVGKTIVFSQFTSMLDLVELAFQAEKIKWLRIDGSVPQPKRASVLSQFESENEMDPGSCQVMLVSLRAGGVGLNLVAASFAVLLDIHWNPQVDLQAQDRIHRHGQTRDVVVKRYIMKDSVEERLIKVQEWKQTMAEGAMGPPTDGEKQQTRLAELKLLFST